MLLSLLLVPLLIGLYFRLLRRREQAAADLGPLGMVQNRSGREVGKRRHVPPLLFLLGIIFLLIGLARPEMTISLPRIEGTVILAFDVSNSMTADDLEPPASRPPKRPRAPLSKTNPGPSRSGS